MFLIDRRIFLFIMETVRSGIPPAGDADAGRCALRGAFKQRRSRLLAPRLGRGSLCGDGWWECLIFDICAASLRMTRWGTGAWYQLCPVKMLAPSARPHPALRATFPLKGEGFRRLCESFLFCFLI